MDFGFTGFESAHIGTEGYSDSSSDSELSEFSSTSISDSEIASS